MIGFDERAKNIDHHLSITCTHKSSCILKYCIKLDTLIMYKLTLCIYCITDNTSNCSIPYKVQ